MDLVLSEGQIFAIALSTSRDDGHEPAGLDDDTTVPDDASDLIAR